MNDFAKSTQRAILVIDDQLGEPGGSHQKSFLRNYSRLPYVFIFEDCRAEDVEGFEVDRAFKALESHPEVELVLLDLKFGEDPEFGFCILKEITRRNRSVPILVMSALDRDVTSLGRCLEEGAVGFVMKHRSAEYLQHTIEHAINLMESHVLLGQSPAMRELRRQAARLSPYQDISVLIAGERGTGKERVARYIWQSGPRARGRFVHVHCLGKTSVQLEDELFGTSKGSREGALVRADHGILYLDSVEALPISLQNRLTRAIQEKGAEARPTRSLSLQIISSTNAPPAELIQNGVLSEEFYDLLTAVKIETPPLRTCVSDIPILANYFLQSLSSSHKQFAEDALRQLTAYHWPGNVRELQRVVQEAVVRSEDASFVRSTHLPETILNIKTALHDLPIAETGIADTKAPKGPDVDAISPWARQRILNELRMAVEIRDKVKSYKGNQWRAEFMRCLYPHYKAQNAKGLADVLKRFTHGPWGDPYWERDPELCRLIHELNH